MLLGVVKKFFDVLLGVLTSYSFDKNYIYKIQEIDELEDQVIISCQGRGAAIRASIDDIGNDEYIVNSLPPHHACWLGYYYGKKWLKVKNKGKYSNCSDRYTGYSKQEIFKIIGQNRAGEILYKNILNEVLYQENPIQLAKSKTISKFDASQAFYIGFLAALKAVKTPSTDFNENMKPIKNKPYLRVVK